MAECGKANCAMMRTLPPPGLRWGPLQLAQLLMSGRSISGTAGTVASGNAVRHNHRALALALSLGHSLTDVSKLQERLQFSFQTQCSIATRGP